MSETIPERLEYRVAYLRGLGWPFTWLFRRDIALHEAAAAEIEMLHKELADAIGAGRHFYKTTFEMSHLSAALRPKPDFYQEQYRRAFWPERLNKGGAD